MSQLKSPTPILPATIDSEDVKADLEVSTLPLDEVSQEAAVTDAPETEFVRDYKVEWVRVIPFILVHLVCLSAIWVGFSWVGLLVGLALMQLRMFGITGFYHRYFSHRAFKTSRVVQFMGAFLGASSGQRGPIWWSAHHRNHHKFSDEPEDAHSPIQHGFLWSHTGWFLNRKNFGTDERVVKDWMKYPELRWLDRFDFLAPVSLGFAIFGLGMFLEAYFPVLETNGPQMLVWGFMISTVLLYHATYCVNSFAHIFGKRRFKTRDDSRNNWWVALLTLGEGWHNNHHYYQNSVRQGFYWWEIDISFYALKVMSWFGLVWDLKPVPKHVLEEGRTPTTETYSKDD
jgi:stearoyl-CoA desaturase (Delta-9 desaturase)